MGKNHCTKCGAKISSDKILCSECQKDADNDVTTQARKKNAKLVKQADKGSKGKK